MNKKLLVVLVLVSLIFSSVAYAEGIKVLLDGETMTFEVEPQKIDDRVMVPMRAIFEALGAEVFWVEEKQEVHARTDTLDIVMPLDSHFFYINGEEVYTDVPATMVNGRTLVPLRVVSQSLGADVLWQSGTVYIESSKYQALNNVRQYQSSIIIDGRRISAEVVEVKKDASIKPVVAFGEDYVGGVESLKSMADRHGALVAINGTYFEAYTEPQEPWGTLIHEGRVEHKGAIGTTLGFTSDGTVKIDTLRINIEGGSDNSWKWPNNWYSYGFNHTPRPDQDAVYIFTPARGEMVGFDYGVNVVVSNGRVVEIVENKDVRIPKDGYVINFLGKETYLLNRFSVGTQVDYRVKYTDKDGRDIDWDDVVEAVGAGPHLVKRGTVIADPAAEGFWEDKVLSLRMARSAFGVKADGSYLLVTSPAATIEEMAVLMVHLGEVDAMSLDGGGSSGLYFNGKYITQPGRDLSNALLLVPVE